MASSFLNGLASKTEKKKNQIDVSTASSPKASSFLNHLASGTGRNNVKLAQKDTVYTTGPARQSSVSGSAAASSFQKEPLTPTGGTGAQQSQDNAANRLRQLEARRSELTAGLDLDGAAALDNDINALRKQLGRTLPQQAAKTVSGMAKAIPAGLEGFLGSTANAWTSLYQGGQTARDAQNKEYLQEYTDGLEQSRRRLDAMLRDNAHTPGTWGDGDIRSQQNIVNDWQRKYDAMSKVVGEDIQRQATRESYKVSDTLSADSARRLEEAKEGLAMPGRILVDATGSLIQNAADLGVNALLGTPGSMGSFAMRAFGGGAQQARQDMEAMGTADQEDAYTRQTLYGLASAAKEIATEKMFGLSAPFGAAYGKGSLDDLAQSAVDRAVARFAGSAAGKRALERGMNFVNSSVSEGMEELIGDWMEWQLPRIYGGDVDTAQEVLENSLYDFLVGSASGGLGDVTFLGANRALDAVTGNTARSTGAQFREMGDDVVQATIDEGLASGSGTISNTLAQELQSKLNRGETVTDRDIGRLYQANLEAIEAENAADQQAQQEQPAAVQQTAQETAQTNTNEMTRQTPQERTQAERAYDTARLDRASSALGENGQKALNATYNGQTGAREYYGGFSAYYQAGVSGQDINNVRSDYGQYLTKGQQYAAYSAGKNDAAVSMAREKEAARFAPVAGEKSGLVYDDFVRQAVESGRTTETIDNETRTYLTAETAERINTLAKDLGVRVRFVDSVAGGRANAQIRGSEVLVERNNPNPVMAIVGHELTHRMQELAPEAYRQFRDIVMQEEGQGSRVQQRMADYARQGVTLDTEAAMDEVAADYAGRMMDDGKVLDDFIRKHQDNRTVLQKLRDAFRALWEKLTGKEKQQAGEAEKKLTAALEAATAQAEQNRQAAAREDGGEARYSLKEYTDAEKQEHAKAALEHFGRTYSWKETGYLTQDGKKIDFSGRNDGGPGGYRTVDHRDISDALGLDYGGDDYSGSMVQFMSEGNIRISPESGGINLSVAPTKAQEQALDDFISKERGEVILDIDTPGGDTVVSVEYPRGTRASKVLADVRQYFKDGTVPQVSELAQFRYSLKETDSQGRELTKEQLEFFMDSKITDEDGRLMVLYHGTTAYGDITKFRRGRSGWLGPGIYLSSRQADAQRYANAMGEGNGKLYELYANVTNPLVVTGSNPVPEILRAAYGRDSVYQARSAKQGNDTKIITPADIKKLQSKGYDGIRWDFGKSTEVSVFSPEQIKRVDNKAPTGSPDIRYSLKRATEEEIRAAERMERDGASREDIWAETGTIRDAAGNWVSEIDDSAMEYHRRGDLGFRERNKDYDRYRQLTEKAESFMLGKSDSWLTDKEQTELTGLQKTWGGTFRKDGRISDDALPTSKLSDYIKHDELFRNYPQLRDTGLVFMDLPDGVNGYYSPQQNVIALRDGLRHAPEDTLVHEIQHALQHLEDRPTGASAEYWEGRVPGVDAKDLYSRTAGEIEARLAQARRKMTAEERRARMPDLGWDRAVFSQNGPRYSLKEGTISKSYEALLRENDALRERVDYWKGQTKRTDRINTDKKAVEQAARALIRDYGAQIELEDIRGDLQSLYDYISSGSEGKDELTYTEARRRAENIARTLVENAVAVDDTLYQDYRDLRKHLNDIKLTISEADSQGLTDYNDFRKRNFGRLNIGKGKTNIDQVYQELAEMWPGLFSEQEYNNPVDQLYHIAEVLDTVSATQEYNPFSGDMRNAVAGAANEIMERFFDLPQTRATFADKQAAKLDKLRWENRDKVKKAIARERGVRERQLQRLKDHYAQVRQNRTERRADSEARTRLLKIAKRLQNKKLPAVSRALLDQYIGDLDTTAKSMTGKTLERLSDLKDWYAEQKENDPDFIADPAIEKELERLSKRHIGDMTAEEVADLTRVLLNIENELRTKRQLIDSEDRRDTYLQGVQVINDIENSGGSKDGGVMGAIDKYIVTETLSPLRQIKRMAGYAKDDPLIKLTNALADGQRASLSYQMEAEKPFRKWAENKKFSRDFSGDKANTITITGLVSGKGPATVEITPAMRASLYLHSLNDQNLRHIREGGITVPDMKLYKQGKLAEAYARGTTIKLTPSQVRSITANMTMEEKAFAKAVHDYFNGQSRDRINEVSEKLKGYSIAQVENYFPINTDTSFTKSDFETLKFDGTLEGMGFLKERMAKAANPIYLRDVNDVLQKSIDQHSRYVGLAIPVRNFNKVWGVTKSSFNDDGSRNSYEGSVQKAVKKAWGESGYNYVEKMMTDLQGGGNQKNVWTRALNKIRSNYAGAVLTLNASVAMKQAASYPTAAAVLGWGPLARAMADTGRVNLDTIAKYTPLQWYRSKGFSTKELGDLRQAGGPIAKVMNNLPPILNWVQGADLLTTRKLWKASEYYVKANNKELAPGTDAYYKAVADIYNRVIEETQPNYTTMQRPQLLRSDDSLLGNLAMFKTQPFQNFNILYDAAGEYISAKKNGVDVKTARKNLGNAVTSQLAQLAVFAGMTMAWALFRGRREKYEDEEGEMSLQSVASALGKDMIGGQLSTVPFGSDAWELVSSKLFGDQYYGMDAVTVTAISDTISSLNGMGELIGSTLKSVASGDDVNWNSARIKLDGYMDDISKAAGVPYENVVNLFNAGYRHTCIAALGKYQGEYAALKLTADPEKKSKDYYDLLYKAMKQAPEQYDAMYRDMVDSGNFKADKISSAMESRMKDSQGVEKVSELDQRYLPPEQEREYSRVQKEISGTNVWRSATAEQRKKAEDDLYNIVTGSEYGEKLAGKISGGASYGIDETDYILYRLALRIADHPTESGKLGTYTNEEVEEAINMLSGLSDEARGYLWEAQGRSEKSNPYT